MQEDLPYHDSLDFHFGQAISWNIPTLKNDAFESLKSYGTHLISNDSIRDRFGVYGDNWIQTLNDRQGDYFHGTAAPILTELFETVALWTPMKPHDYEALKQSKPFITILRTNIANRKMQLGYYQMWLEDFLKLESQIAKEINLDKERIKSMAILGSALPGGWEVDVPLLEEEGVYTLTTELSDGAIKFRANGNWVINWGGFDFPEGRMIPDGSNIPVAAGRYLIRVDLAGRRYEVERIGE